VQAPQQQGHATHQVEKNHASHVLQFRQFDSNGQAIANRPGINPSIC